MKKGMAFALALVLVLGSVLVFKRAALKNALEVHPDPTHSSSMDPQHPADGSGSSSESKSAAGTQGTTNGGNSSQTGSSVAGVNGSTEVTKPAAPESNCFNFDYRHLKEARNQDVENFLDYSNAFPIHHKNVNDKSICVKVNDKPVPFKVVRSKSQDEILIGSVVGPESVIHVAYCTGTAPCREACAVKSNQMMDDLMSDAGGDSDDFKDSWGDASAPGQQAQKKELQDHVKALRTVASENSDLGKQNVMRNWDTLKSHDWFCKSDKSSKHLTQNK